MSSVKHEAEQAAITAMPKKKRAVRRPTPTQLARIDALKANGVLVFQPMTDDDDAPYHAVFESTGVRICSDYALGIVLRFAEARTGEYKYKSRASEISMQRRHFEFVAATLRAIDFVTCSPALATSLMTGHALKEFKLFLAQHFADALERTNCRFSRAKFIQAVTNGEDQ